MPELYDIGFLLIHQIYPTNATLAQKGIINTAVCGRCNAVDTLIHRLCNCEQNKVIWAQYVKIMCRITRYSFQNYAIEDIIYFPAFSVFPKAKKRLMFWLTCQTFQFLLNYESVKETQLYISTMLFNYMHIPMSNERKRTMYANYIAAVYI